MAERSDITPKFDSPPVIETALSVEFKPLEKWGIPHFGLFWQRIRQSFPEFSVKAPLASEIETFDKPKLVTAQIEFMSEPEVRCWFFDSKADQLIQVQHDRFVHNWRRTGDRPYPSYDAVRPSFESNWDVFSAFLREEDLGRPQVVQCEMTYVNHFESGREWTAMNDLPRVLMPWSGKLSEGFLPSPEQIQMAMSFLMPDNRGRLRIGLQPVIRTADRKVTLQLTLIARGAPASSEKESILEWFDLGHEWIVRGFADLTSPEMHRLWKRRR